MADDDKQEQYQKLGRAFVEAAVQLLRDIMQIVKPEVDLDVLATSYGNEEVANIFTVISREIADADSQFSPEVTATLKHKAEILAFIHSVWMKGIA